MDPWYKVVIPRKEVREGRSFGPDELAIALEQVVAGTAPEDHRDPAQLFARTCFTRELREHAGMVLRGTAGREGNRPAMTPTPVAVIGCGRFGRYHAEKLAAIETAELVAVVDTDALVAERAASSHGCLALADGRELAGRVEAVGVVVSIDLHGTAVGSG